MGMLVIKGVGTKKLKGRKIPKSMRERQDVANKMRVEELRRKLKAEISGNDN